MGAARGRAARRSGPASVVNISGMSFGSLSGNAIEALNQGAALAGCLQNTGEGALSPYHRNGGDLVFQIGTATSAAATSRAASTCQRLVDLVRSAPVRAIEIKLSQGAKPGLGGMLPGAKVSDEIAEIRGIPQGVDCASPSRHAVFDDVDSMLDFVETVADATGLPVGIKSAVGNMDVLGRPGRGDGRGRPGRRLRQHRRRRGRHGRGAADLRRLGGLPVPARLRQVYRRFAAAGLTDDVTFIGAGKLGIPENAVVAFALGADMINVGREAMLAIGCIQAQKCHTDHCPVGVATQNPRYTLGLDPELEVVRAANYVRSLRRDLLKVSEAVGVVAPRADHAVGRRHPHGHRSTEALREVYGYEADWGADRPDLRTTIEEIMMAQGESPLPRPSTR